MKPPCERDCPTRAVGCHAKCELYLEYEEAKQAEYRAREVERSRDAYTADAEKRSRSVARLKRMGLLK
jgi:hypothetical protein|nr:MAG TPA: hypothetical protein [Caudoviricetes sp.]